MKRRLTVSDPDLIKSLGNQSNKVKWEPVSFVVESPRMKSRIIEADLMEEGLKAFEENPRRAMTYMVTGNPDDGDALTFAHYLMQLHKEKVQYPNIVFRPVLGTFEPILEKDENPSMIVLHNITVNSSNLKYEKVRDVIVRHKNVPIVIVAAGEDPISFVATRLRVPGHAIAYFFSGQSAEVQEVL